MDAISLGTDDGGEDADLAARLGGEATLAALVQQLDLNEKSAAGMATELRARFDSVEALAEALPVLKARLQAQRNATIKAAVAAEVAAGSVAQDAATETALKRMNVSNARLWSYLVRQAVAAFCTDEATGDVVAEKEARCRQLISEARPRRRKRAAAAPVPALTAAAQMAAGAATTAEATAAAQAAAAQAAAAAAAAAKHEAEPVEAAAAAAAATAEREHEHASEREAQAKPEAEAQDARAPPRSGRPAPAAQAAVVVFRLARSPRGGALVASASSAATAATTTASEQVHISHAAERLAVTTCTICFDPLYHVASATDPDDERACFLRLGCGHEFCARAECGGVLVAEDETEQRCPLCRVHVTRFVRFQATLQSFAAADAQLDFFAPAGLEARRLPSASKIAAAAAERAEVEEQREELEAHAEAHAAELELAACSTCRLEAKAADVVICELCGGGFCEACRGRALRSQLEGHYVCLACRGAAGSGGGGGEDHEGTAAPTSKSQSAALAAAAGCAAGAARAVAIFRSAQERDARARAMLLAAYSEASAEQEAAAAPTGTADRRDEQVGGERLAEGRAKRPGADARPGLPDGRLLAFAHALLLHGGERLEDFVVGCVKDERLCDEAGEVTLHDLRHFVQAGNGGGVGRSSVIAAMLLRLGPAADAHARQVAELGPEARAAVAAAFVVLNGK